MMSELQWGMGNIVAYDSGYTCSCGCACTCGEGGFNRAARASAALSVRGSGDAAANALFAWRVEP
jgi:hypothetical protein